MGDKLEGSPGIVRGPPPEEVRLVALSSECLFVGRQLSIRHVRCRCAHPDASEMEEAECDSLVFVLGGYFAKHLGRRHSVLAGPGTGLFFAAGRPYRVSHPGPPGDDCLVLQHSSTAMRSTLIDIAGIESLRDRRLQSHSVLPLALVATCPLFAERLRNGVVGSLEASEIALALLAATVRSGLRVARKDRTRPQTRARRIDQVHAAQALLMDRLDASISLQQVAAQVGASPFHLARIFRQHVGMPLYEFQLQNRLSKAATEMLHSDRSLAEIGLDCGFGSHSHFSSAFTRRAGISPARFRNLVCSSHYSQVSKIIKAMTSVDVQNAPHATCD